MELPQRTLLVALTLAPGLALKGAERDAITAAALTHYFSRHAAAEPACIAVGGHKPPGRRLRELMRGVELDRDPQCHFREDGIVYGVPTVTLLRPGIAEVEVAKFRFGDVSTFLEQYDYRLEKKTSWVVTAATPHPWNTSTGPKKAP